MPNVTPMNQQAVTAGGATDGQPDVATLANGNFVVTYTTPNSTNGSTDTTVWINVYGPTGTAVVSATQVNVYTADNQSNPTVTALTGGRFVVTWQSYNQDTGGVGNGFGSEWGVYARVFEADGTPVGAEFRVQASENSIGYQQQNPQVVAGWNSDFYITWESWHQDRMDVLVRRFQSSGIPWSNFDTIVHTSNAGDQFSGSGIALQGGDFLFLWAQDTAVNGNTDVYGRVFQGSLNPFSSPFQLNTSTIGAQTVPQAVGLLNGASLAVWQSEGQDGDGSGIFLRRFNSTGMSPDTTDILVNQTTPGNQTSPSIARLSTGEIVIVWASDNVDGDGVAIVARYLNADGTFNGDQFTINTITTGNQVAPEVSALALGGFVVTWQDDQTGDVAQRIYVGNRPETPTTTGADTITGTAGNDTFLVNPANIGTGDVIDGLGGTDTIEMNAAGTLNLTAPTTFTGVEVVQGSSGDDTIIVNQTRLTGLTTINGGTGNDALQLSSAGTLDLTRVPVTGGSELQVNQIATGDQTQSSMIRLPNGNSMVAWVSTTDNISGTIRYRLFDAAGTPLANDVNVATGIQSGNPELTLLTNGNVLLTWFIRDIDGSQHGIRGTVLDSTGTTVVPEFTVNQVTDGSQLWAFSTPLAGGGFAVMFRSPDANGTGTYLRIFDANGVATTNDILVNQTTVGSQEPQSLVTLSDGTMVAGFVDYSGIDGSGSGVFYRRFAADGAPLGNETRINTVTGGNQANLTLLPLGTGFLAVYDSQYTGPEGNDQRDVLGQRFDANGNRLGGEFIINQNWLRDQYAPVVTELANGNFVVVWVDIGMDSVTDARDAIGLQGQVYDANGNRIGDNFRVNTTSYRQQVEPDIVANPDGSFTVSWSSNEQDAVGTYGIFMRNFTVGNGVVVSGIERLIGTAGDDTFRISAADLATFTYEAGTGTDTLWISGAGNINLVGRDFTSIERIRFDVVETVNVTVGSYAQALLISQVIDAPNTINLIASGFNTTQAERNALYGLGIDTIREGIYLYSASTVRVDIGTPPTQAERLAFYSQGITQIFYNTTTYTLATEPEQNTGAVETFTGTAGDDLFNFNANFMSGDTIDGGAGTDTIRFTGAELIDLRSPASITGIERIIGTSGNDTIRVNNDRLAGLTSIDGGAGFNQLASYSSGTVDFTGIALPNIRLISGLGGLETFVVTFDQARTIDFDFGGGQPDVLRIVGSGNLNLSGRAYSWVSRIEFEPGSTVDVTFDNSAWATVVAGTNANITVRLNNHGLNQTQRLTMYANGVDTIYANGQVYTLATEAPQNTAGSDTINGTSGNDIVLLNPVDLGAGDVITGGAGNDTVQMTSAGTLDITLPTTFSGFEVINGSGGNDTLVVSDARLAGITTLNGGAGTDAITLGAPGSLDLSGIAISGFEQVNGSSGNDVITVTAAQLAALAFDGGAGNDELRITGSNTLDLSGRTFPGIERITFASGTTNTVTTDDLATALLLGGTDATITLNYTGPTLTAAQRLALYAQGVDTINFNGQAYTLAGEVPPTPMNDFGVSTATSGYQADPQITALANGFVIAWESNGDIRGQVFAADGTPVGASDILISTTNQNSQERPQIAALANGGFVVTWQSTDNGSNPDVRAQVFAANGTPVDGTDILVSTNNLYDQAYPQITALRGVNAGFVITWQSGDAYAHDIHGRVFSADGTPVNGADSVFSTSNSSGQEAPQITALANGGFVVTWQSRDNFSSYDIRAQVFSANGTPVDGTDILVSTTNTGNQEVPQITALTNGGFVITWYSAPYNSEEVQQNPTVRVQVFQADGTPVGGTDILVSVNNPGFYPAPQVTALANGRFVITWESSYNGSDGDILARVFAADGTPLNETEILVSTSNDLSQTQHQITTLANGGFVITWTSDDNGSNSDIRARVFAADGTPINAEDILVSTTNTDYQTYPQVTALANGGFTVTWQSRDPYFSYEIRARVFNADGTPLGVAGSVAGTAGADTLSTGAGPLIVDPANIGAGDEITGTPGNDDVIALTTAGTLDLTAPTTFSGIETVIGSGGSDTFLVSSDRLADVQQIIGGDGQDTLRLAIGGVLDVSGNLLAGVETVEGSSDSDVIRVDEATFNGGVTRIVGGNGADDLVLASPGTYNLSGTSLSGMEAVVGSFGDDAIIIDAATFSNGVENINGGNGTDTVRASGPGTLDVSGDRLSSVEIVEGSGGDDVILVNHQAIENGITTINGGEGTDTVRLRSAGSLNLSNVTLNSIERVEGSSGNDTVTINAALLGVVAFAGGNGTDTLRIADGGAVDISGNRVSNFERVEGSGNADTFTVNEATFTNGVATLAGGDGVDIVRLSAAGTLDVRGTRLTNIETVEGTAGNDVIIVDAQTFGSGVTTINGGGGTDELRLASPGTLDLTGITITGIEGIYGTAGQDTIIGTAGNDSIYGLADNDLLDGGGGDDTFRGGAGNDIYLVDSDADAVIELGSEGGDEVRASVSTYTLGANVENLTLTGSAITGTGNGLNNIITGNGEANTLIGGGGSDTISGGAGDDDISGDADNDVLTGGEGNDTLRGGTGADAMSGGANNDTYVVDDAGDTVTELADEGTDRVQASIIYTLGDNVEELEMLGSDPLIGSGNALNNTIWGNSGNNILDGGAGADTLRGNAGNDIYIVDNEGDSAQDIDGGGTDEVRSSVSYTISAYIENLTLTGSGNINGTGNFNANIITGNSGGNVITGGTGADTLRGNAGNDIFEFEGTSDLASGEIIDGGADTDTIRVTGTNGLDLTAVSLTVSSIERLDWGTAGSGTIRISINQFGAGFPALLAIDGNANANHLVIQLVQNLSLQGTNFAFTNWSANDTITWEGSNGNDIAYGTGQIDIMNGGDGNDMFYAGVGNDFLNGGVSDDYLDGGAGTDTMSGGAGNDQYIVHDTSDVVIENAGEGNDIIYSYVSYTLADNVETLQLLGGDDINATGNASNGNITGNAGNNIIDGREDADGMAGRGGDDIYIVDNLGDTVFENANEGIDEVRSSVAFTLGANVENLTLTGSDNINATGNSGNNTITGNAGNNTLDGAGGTDTLIGGTGNDIYITDGGDTITENPNEGTDEVRSSVEYTLGGNLENLTLTGTGHINGTGNSGNNTIIGNSGNNTLDGAGGTDTLIGGTGNDIYITDGGDTITEQSGQGTDEVRSSVTYTLGENLENLTLTGTDNINGTGNSGVNIIIGNSGANIIDGGGGADSMRGGDGGDTYFVDDFGDDVVETGGVGTDTVYGNTSLRAFAGVENFVLTGTDNLNAVGNVDNNTITGNSGNNILDGGTGTDTLIGGLGNDRYIVDNAGDVVTEQENQGNDTVYTTVDYTLSANIENLELGVILSFFNIVPDISGTGNALNNTITGNSGSNTLDGGAGADLLRGSLGNDIYITDGLDTIEENANEGTDEVRSSVTYTLGANLENLTLIGTDNINGTGNSGANIITGNSGANTLNGGGGNDVLEGGEGNDTLDGGTSGDTMRGGAGDDIYYHDDGGDIIVEGVNAGNDTVYGSGSIGAIDNVEAFILTGTGNNSVWGNALNNTITGNSGNNTLYGQGGADTLIGSLGDDTYIVENAGDVVTELENQGTDTVVAAISYTLVDHVENLQLGLGAGNINGTGNALNNTITGNSGNNIIDGGAGADRMSGLGGNDIYIVDNAGDVVEEFVDGGFDTIRYTQAGPFDISGPWLAHIEAVEFTSLSDIITVDSATFTYGVTSINGQGGVDTVRLAIQTLDVSSRRLTSIERLEGTAGNDTIIIDQSTILGGVTAIDGGTGTDTLRLTGGSVNLSGVTLTGIERIETTANNRITISVSDLANASLIDGSNAFVILDATSLALTRQQREALFTQGIDQILQANNTVYYPDGTGIRTLLSPVQVNTYTTSMQENPVVTTLEDGSYVVIWDSLGQDGSSQGVYGRRYNENGTPASGEFRINTETAGQQFIPSVTGLSDGGFVVVWHSEALDGDLGGVFAQRYAANGTALGVEFRVNFETANNQTQPTVTGLANGGFVVSWTSGWQDGFGWGIYARRYSNDGVALGDEFLVNQTTAHHESLSSITALTNGNFVVTWQSNTQDGSNSGVFGRLFAANGTPINNEFQINTTYAAAQENVSVTALSTGGFVAVWQSYDQDTFDTFGVFGQRYNADGTTEGVEFRVNATTANNQTAPSVAGLANGGFVVVWQGPTGNGQQNSVFAQWYDSRGIAQGVELVIATTASNATPGALMNPTVTATGNSGFIVTWQEWDAQNGGVYEIRQAIYEALGNNVLTPGTDILIGGPGADIYTGIPGDLGATDQVTGDAGTDTIQLIGSGTLDLTVAHTFSGIETINAFSGDDIFIVSNARIADLRTIDGNDGTDIIRLGGTSTLDLTNLTLTSIERIEGTSGNDTITGTAGADTIHGLGGNDAINGGAGADTLAGGAGDDTYTVDNALDVITELANEGTDAVSASVSYTLSDNIENLTLAGTGDIAGGGNALGNIITGNAGNNSLVGNAGADTLTGGDGNDNLYGGADADILQGGNNNDYLQGDGGADEIRGGDGNDNIWFFGSSEVVTGEVIDGGTGTDAIYIAATTDLRPATITSIEAIEFGVAVNADAEATVSSTQFGTGLANNLVVEGDNFADTLRIAVATGATFSGADFSFVNWTAGTDRVIFDGSTGNETITGTSQADVINGNNGNDILDGGLGADTMAGGADNDIYIVDNAADTATEAANGGSDEVRASVSYTLSGNIEVLRLTGTGDIDGTGDAGANDIFGTSGNNRLDGAAGADRLEGGFGNDTYIVDNVGDLVVEGLNEGTDNVSSSINYTLTANVENLTLTGAALNATGNDLNNVITGNAGNNLIDGGTGADTMNGGAGDDVYIVDNVGDIVNEDPGQGTDEIRSSLSLVDMARIGGAFIENAVLTSNSNANVLGNTSDNRITGNAFDNLINGMVGNDTMIGGAGNDTYVVDAAGDVVVENANEGTDTIQTSVTSYSVADQVNIEDLQASGPGNFTLTGNALNNRITTADGNDYIDGGSGNDTMTGGAGNDVYIVDSLDDVVIEDANGGFDEIRTSVNYQFAANVEMVTFTGAAQANAVGNELDNTLVGNTGHNILDGGAGADTMRGGGGDDTYIVDNAGDIVIEVGGEGMDEVFASISYTLSSGVDALYLTGTNNINATGNELGNTLFGNEGNNILDGGEGADTMSGGGGDDIYIVDSIYDTVAENGNEGTDEVRSSIDHTLATNVENLTLTGNGTIAGTGNSLANIIIGNGAANVLDGGTGNDLLTGAGGDDVFVFNRLSGADTITDFVAGGNEDSIDLRAFTTLRTFAQVMGIATQVGTNTVLTFSAGNTLTLLNVTLGNLQTNDFIVTPPPVSTMPTPGDDVLTGTPGNDLIDGLAGNDQIDAGAGDDRVVYDAADAQSNINGGAGFDTLVVNGAVSPPSNFNLVARGFEQAQRVMSDTGNANIWNTLTETYDQSWRLTTADARNDNGTRTLTSFDAALTQSWAIIVQEFNAAGTLAQQRTQNDDGSIVTDTIDTAGAFTWRSTQDTFNAAGERTIQRIYNDDNSYRFFFVDPATTAAPNGQHNWRMFDEEYNAAGQRHVQRITNDDGTLRYFYWDVTNAQSWASFDEIYNAQGQRLEQSVVNDNGSIVRQFWDVGNAQSYSSYVDYANAAGQRTEQLLYHDAGGYTRYIYDPTNVQSWDLRIEIFDVNGQLISRSDS